MIPAHEVDAAVLVCLRATGRNVHDLKAPTGAETPYTVVEYPPAPGWSESEAGDIDDPEAELWRRYRLRTVGSDHTQPATLDGAREQAVRLHHEARTALLDRDTPIDGPGWIVSSRFAEATGPVDAEGPVVNVTEDFILWAVPA